MTTITLPKLPLVCLKTADDTTTIDVVKGKNTVIDFWTTKCTRCPDALTKLDEMAQDSKYANIQFISICCDKCDGAREIIEKDDELRWQHVSHYYMCAKDKEIAKEVLGFKAVPFYVVLNNLGEITQLGGSKKIDFDALPGMIRSEAEKENAEPQQLQKKELAVSRKAMEPQEEKMFILEDLDF